MVACPGMILVVPVILVGFTFLCGASGKSFGATGHFEAKVDACDQVAVWEQVDEARNMDDVVVQLVQNQGPQLFYTVKCQAGSENLPCRGIESTISSRCETRFNAIAALVYDDASPTGFRWDMIMLPGQCVCTELVNGTSLVL